MENLEKARITKYIKRIPNPKGKGWLYFYNVQQWKDYQETGKLPDQKKEKFNLIDSMKNFFGLSGSAPVREKIKSDYKSNDIQGKYNITLLSWIDHLTEYFGNKEKWDKFFTRKPGDKGEGKKPTDKKDEKKSKEDRPKSPIRLTVMKEIFALYGGKKEEAQAAPVEAVPPAADAAETVKNIDSIQPSDDRNNFDTMPEREKKDQETTNAQKEAAEKTPEQIDKQASEAVAGATPENRSEMERKFNNTPKEAFQMSFAEFSKDMLETLDPFVVNRLKKEIEFHKDKLDRALKYEAERQEKYGSIKPQEYMESRYHQSRIRVYENTLQEYTEGKLDNNLNPSETYMFLKRKYDEISDKNSSEAKSIKRKLSLRETKAKNEHIRLIEKAIKDGKVVPADVLKEYPEIIKENAKAIQRPDIGYKPTTIERDTHIYSGSGEKTPAKIKLNDYSQINPKDVYLSDEETILDVPRPSYIPEMDLQTFAGYKGKDQKFDIVKIGKNQYVIVDKRYPAEPDLKSMTRKNGDIENAKMYLMSAETLAATWDYYRKLYRANLIKEHNEKQDREEDWYNKKKQDALAAGKEWKYAPFQRKGIRPPSEPLPDSMHMSYRQAFLMQDFLGIDATVSEIKSGHGNVAVFENYHETLRDLEYRINDMRLQRKYDDENNTFDKGRETAYGDSNTKDTILESHGVMIKRQNGKELDEADIQRISMALDSVYEVFGDKKEATRKYGLKISYSGETRMHASKAVGLFVESKKCIGLSDFSLEGRGFTFAHEFAHFMDSYIGDKKGYRYGTDEDDSPARVVASKFRDLMKIGASVKPDMEKYYKKTTECFARAMEQYYAIKQGTQESLYKPSEKTGEYVDHEKFVKDVMPLCEKFLEESKDLLKAMMFDATKRFIRIGHDQYVRCEKKD